jgi:hypothetical protein
MDKRPGILPELIIPVGAVVFTIYYLATVQELPFQAKVVGIYVGGAIVLLSLILFARFAMEIFKGKKALNFHGFFSDPVSEGRRWGVLAATCLFIGLMPVVGFVVSLFAYVLVTVILVGGMARLRTALILATSLTAVAFFIFIIFVKVRFPLTGVDTFLRSLVL